MAFTDTSDNTPTGWNWSFGNGLYSDDQNPVQVFYVGGRKTVTLIATNEAGSNTTVNSTLFVRPRSDYKFIQGYF